MRIALLSDIHANLTALEAVLADAETLGAEAFWQLGDVVGYGPDPREVVERLRSLGAIGVMGNHDAAAVGRLGTEEFNPAAALAASWTANQLDEPCRTWLRALPEVRREGDVTLCHGALQDPIWEYLLTTRAVERHFALQETPLSITGHTHLALAIFDDERGFDVTRGAHDLVVQLDERKAMVNPGSAGQPRDGDPRVGWALFDDEARTVRFRRVAYDIAAVQQRMRAADLPTRLIDRLAVGR